MRRFLGAVSLVLGLIVAGSTGAVADQVYHSENLPLSGSGLEGHPELRSGQVVNIHPNGPVNYALERYMVNGARPATEYHIVIEIHDDSDCTSDEPGTLPTTTLTTNAQGNGHAKFTIPPEVVDEMGLHGVTLNIRWSLRVEADDGPEAYGTDCTEVTLD